MKRRVSGSMSRSNRILVMLGLESRYGHEVLDVIAHQDCGTVLCLRSVHDTADEGPFQNAHDRLPEGCEGAEFVVPLLTPGRKKLRVLEGLGMGLRPADVLMHPMSVRSPSTQVGPGSVLGPLAAIGAHSTIGEFFLANRSASVGHDCRIGSYCSIGPGSVICGNCILDDGVFVGAGAVICPKVHVGMNAVVAAGSVVTRDVPAHSMVAGNRARAVKTGIAGYREIGV